MSQLTQGRRLPKIPTVTRFLNVAALLVWQVVAEPALAQVPVEHSARVDLAPVESAGAVRSLTETQAVGLALDRAAFTTALAGEQGQARGQALAATARAGPEIAYSREQTFGPAGTAEDYLSVSQSFDLADRRRLAGVAGDWRAQAVAQGGQAERAELATAVRLRFYAALYLGLRVESLQRWQEQLDNAVTVVAKRQARGDAAPYDRRRLQREQKAVAANIEREQAAHQRSLGQLAICIGLAVEASVSLAGTLLPSTESPAVVALRQTAARRPDLQALSLRAQAAQADSVVARRAAWPDLRVQLGWKGVDLGNQGRSDGYSAAAALHVPLWDPASGHRQAADAAARAALARRALAESQVGGTLTTVHAQASRLRQLAVVFRAQAGVGTAELVRTATAGYVGGELGLLELLDAWRCAHEDALTALDLEYAARQARIELAALAGENLP